MNRKSIFFLSLLIFILGNLNAQNLSVIDTYIQNYKDIAIKEMQRTGVPASITLAQGIQESGAGLSELSKHSNNQFGIKCKPEWTGQKYFHDDDEKNECFRVYSTVEESFIDHSNFLKSREYYQSLFLINPLNYKEWSIGLYKCGYATNINYANDLINTIEKYDLQQYTLQALIKKP